MGKRENEGKKEKKQKKERKEKRKQYRGLYLNPISVPRARTRACEGRRWRSSTTASVRSNATSASGHGTAATSTGGGLSTAPTSTPRANAAAKSATPSPPSRTGSRRSSARKAVRHEGSHNPWPLRRHRRNRRADDCRFPRNRAHYRSLRLRGNVKRLPRERYQPVG